MNKYWEAWSKVPARGELVGGDDTRGRRGMELIYWKGNRTRKEGGTGWRQEKGRGRRGRRGRVCLWEGKREGIMGGRGGMTGVGRA